MNRSENTFNLNVYLVEFKIIRKELTDFYVVVFRCPENNTTAVKTTTACGGL